MAHVTTLVLLRHGESEWNARNLFTGWVDVDLTDRGVAEARRGGELLRAVSTPDPAPGVLPSTGRDLGALNLALVLLLGGGLLMVIDRRRRTPVC